MKQICVYLRSSAVKKFQKIKQPIIINLEKSQQVVDQLMQIPRGHNIVVITKNLPEEFRSSLPSIEEIEAELSGGGDG
ncbi:MAG: hypothetical protein KKA10_10545 [Euryarchaeota archaeon]|nr:hypothetical protein [Euryarchaeota archaeon]MCG2738433.1 hypothetical protein [Candidatus Methanoperedenaceae archaeon]